MLERNSLLVVIFASGPAKERAIVIHDGDRSII